MNFWYSPLLETQLNTTSQLPAELLSAVTAPCRTTAELEAVRAKAKTLAHYDLAGAAHDALLSRKQQQAGEAIRTLRKGHRQQLKQHGDAAADTHAAVASMWGAQLDHLRSQAAAALMDLQDKHEDALQKLRLKQVDRAYYPGIRPQQRNTELLNLRRSEAVLASKNDFAGASRIKSRADQLAEAEAAEAHRAWLLRCHGEEERLLEVQRREMEGLRRRWDARLRDVEAARDCDLEQLGRKIKVNTTNQQRDFTRERKHVEAALRGCMLNTRTTMALLAASQPPPERPTTAPLLTALRSPSETSRTDAASRPGSAYLGPSSGSKGTPVRTSGKEPATTLSVRFAPTPVREAWSERSGSSTSTSSTPRPQTPPLLQGPGSPASAPLGGEPAAAHAEQAAASEPLSPAAPPTAPSSAAVGSGTTSGATGSGSSALTEAAVKAINQATGVQTAGAKRVGGSTHS
ncbi:hypothetical protein Agub_g4699, partial [Astrephomene gubernaculifera]